MYQLKKKQEIEILNVCKQYIEVESKAKLVSSLQSYVKQNFKQYYSKISQKQAQLLQQCESIIIDHKGSESIDDILTSYEILRIKGEDISTNVSRKQIEEIMQNSKQLHNQIQKIVQSYNKSIEGFLQQARAKIREVTFYDINQLQKRNLKAILTGNSSPDIKKQPKTKQNKGHDRQPHKKGIQQLVMVKNYFQRISKKKTYVTAFQQIKTQTACQQVSPYILDNEIFKEGLGSWAQPMKNFLSSSTFQNIYKYVKNEYQSGKKIYPPQDMIFNAFKTTPIQNVKVVIIGQDPYNLPNLAHGYAFSVMKPVAPPPSLKNIYKNLQNDAKLNFKAPNHGDLSKWAEQGVFLLNAILTVEDSKPNSHSQYGWQKFTDEVIDTINKNCTGVVYLLWGKPAQTKAKSVNPTKNKILQTSHPSPLSAHQGFMSCKHFSECNQYLESIGKTPIDWNL